ncbi:MAG: DUF1667 domain-containing protein [Clostridia bacterium]|jgi:CxxC motif-containing protein|nr:DUF1667 domain-containing protein [Clostridia bacterium]MDD3232475.1 DUF1667 domain-containing protein [Clostridia bacterium]MDD3862956.1 DUF1667 domain-containing protein [Clostridia bacterium]MDD4408726.1 DUF1667 domain-containing protein [Clostridia bacterium]
MLLKETTCIVCPVGCNLKIEKINDEIKVSGNLCMRGNEYGKSEITNPKRIVTCSIDNKDKIYFVKTTLPIPKSLVFETIKEIKKIPTKKSFNIGDIALKNILNTDADVVITGFHNKTL